MTFVKGEEMYKQPLANAINEEVKNALAQIKTAKKQDNTENSPS